MHLSFELLLFCLHFVSWSDEKLQNSTIYITDIAINDK